MTIRMDYEAFKRYEIKTYVKDRPLHRYMLYCQGVNEIFMHDDSINDLESFNLRMEFVNVEPPMISDNNGEKEFELVIEEIVFEKLSERNTNLDRYLRMVS